MLKRVFLFVLTNLAVMVMVSIVLAVLGQLGVLDMAGGGHAGLLLICAVWGFGAAFVSLLISRWMAKRAFGVRLVTPDTRDADAQWLYNTVARLAQQANLPMPEVGVYDSPELNAFATGPSKKRSLVAVSTGLLRRMDRSEVEGVLGHEMAHIANGDMVTMTLIQGVVNAFVLYLAHLAAMVARSVFSRGDEEEGPGLMGFFVSQMAFIAAQIVFGLLGTMVVAWFSRQREYRADAGGAALAGRGSMVAALRRLMQSQGKPDASNPEFATLKISGGSRVMALLSTHPPLEHRIAVLEGRA